MQAHQSQGSPGNKRNRQIYHGEQGCKWQVLRLYLVDDAVALSENIASLEASKIVGVDMGITDLAITSEGHKTGNPRFIRNAQRNLKRKQQALSRCKKGSKWRAKARLIVAKAHERVAFGRNDFQHKLSKQLIDENQAVIVETLKIKNMLKNHCLARAIADAGWDSLITKLEYKAKQAGKHLIKIDRNYLLKP